MDKDYIKELFYDCIYRYRVLLRVLIGILIIFILSWTIKFFADFITYYLKIFNNSNSSSKLTAMSTMIAFFVGEVASGIFISWQVSSAVKNMIYSKKYDAMDGIIDSMYDLDIQLSKLKTSIDYLKFSMYKVVQRDPLKIKYLILSNNEAVQKNYKEYLKVLNDTALMSQKILNEIDKNDIKYVDESVNPLEFLTNTLFTMNMLRFITDNNLDEMTSYLENVKNPMSDKEQKHMHHLLTKFKGVIYEQDISRCKDDIKDSIKSFKKAKFKNR